MRRPSPALVVAVIALVVSMTGSATAVHLIRSKDIKDRSIQGRDIRSNTLTGRVVKGLSGRDVIANGLDGSDIDEDTLETVPSAARLAHAGVGPVAYRSLAGGERTRVYDAGGLVVEASCDGSGNIHADARPSADGGLLRVTVRRPGSPAETTLVTDDDFSGADEASLVAGGDDDAAGTLVHTSAAGDVTTLEYLAQSRLNPDRGFRCVLAGTVTHATP